MTINFLLEVRLLAYNLIPLVENLLVSDPYTNNPLKLDP